jgi:hypothetical protein
MVWWISLVNDATGDAVSVEYATGQDVGIQAQLKAASDLVMENRLDHRARHVLLVNPDTNVANETPKQRAERRERYKNGLRSVESARQHRIEQRKQRLAIKLCDLCVLALAVAVTWCILVNLN